MSGAVTRAGHWRIKPSAQLPILHRFMINSSFTPENAAKADIHTVLANRTYVKHMMYWEASEYDVFEKEVADHLRANDGWFERYCERELLRSEALYSLGVEYEHTDWSQKSATEIAAVWEELVQKYRELACPWYAQYPLDEFFEEALEQELSKKISADHPDFRKFVLTFADPEKMTEVAEERWQLLRIAKDFAERGEQFDRMSSEAEEKIAEHLKKFSYINRGLTFSPAYNRNDIIERLREIFKQIKEGAKLDDIIYEASEKKIEDDYVAATAQIKPAGDFLRIIKQARHHSYLRNRRVEAFFRADYGASFMYAEAASQLNYPLGRIQHLSPREIFAALRGSGKLPDEAEIAQRVKNYAMVVRQADTTLVTDPVEIRELEQTYAIQVEKVEEIQGRVACLGGIIRGRAKICLDKDQINKVQRGDILIAQFTTPDFVPAMERAAAIVADQGGLSSHAAIVSRELGVPCVIATERATRVIHDNDLIEVNARTGLVKVIERHTQ